MNSVHGKPVGVGVICTGQGLGIWFSYMEVGVVVICTRQGLGIWFS